MTDLKFIVDTTQLKEALAITKKAERGISDLAKRYSSGALTQDQYSDAVKRYATELQKASGGTIQARNAINNYSKSVLKTINESKLAKVAVAMEREELALYTKARRMATRENLEYDTNIKLLIADSRLMAKAINNETDSIQRNTSAIRNANGVVNQFGQKSKLAGKNLNKMGMYAQQTGYQVGDFAVQMQGGTHWATALGQQGAQLLGIFGPAGALAGAALAIGTALVIPLEAATQKVKGLREDVEKFLKTIEEANTLKAFGGNEISVKIAEVTSKIIAQEKILNRLDKQIKNRVAGRENTTYAEELERLSDKTKERIADEEEELNLLVSQLGILRAQQRVQETLVNDQVNEQKNLVRNEERYAEEKAAREKTARENKYDLDLQLANDFFTAHEEGLKEQYKQQEEDAAQAALNLIRILQAEFDATTFLLRVRFSQEEEVFSQDVASSGKMKPSQSYPELIGMGWTPEDLDRIGVNAPRGKGKGGGSKKETQEEYLAKLEREIEVKRESLGLYGEEREIMAEVAKLKEQVIKKDYDISEAKLEQIVREGKALEDRLAKEQDLYDTITNSVSDSLMSLVEGTKTVEEAFKDMLLNIVKQIYEQQVLDPISNAAGGFLTDLIGGLKGGLTGGSKVKAYASGGVVSSPTTFPMSGGTGLMGEAGPEAIMPLKRTANGDLGVNVSGAGGGETIIIEQHFSFSANGDESVKKIIAQAAPKIAELAKSQVMSARSRGGQMKATFK
jgi:hypothetical protein